MSITRLVKISPLRTTFLTFSTPQYLLTPPVLEYLNLIRLSTLAQELTQLGQ